MAIKTQTRQGKPARKTRKKSGHRAPPQGISAGRTAGGGGRISKGGPSSSIGFEELIARREAVDLVRSIRDGINAKYCFSLRDYFGLRNEELAGLLHLPESTAYRLVGQDAVLDPAVSERILRVAELTRLATETFNDRDRAIEWLKKPNLALGSVSALSLLDTAAGEIEVRRVLSAIDYGGAV